MKTINLLSGQYTPAEASDLVLQMLNHTINYYKIKNWSSQVRFNEPDAESMQRLKELQQAKQQLEVGIRQAQEQGQLLTLQSTLILGEQQATPHHQLVPEAECSRAEAC
ncbi:hypothetical protein [Cesiribacter andamanensis]|uniref:Uncharacterized protein n=1 Tax=Cesiribacter andamanensis AMV16 TaxID=1279009 RepID=M7MZB7_9BACT|nr:hypothetical protein [Cesiribacter andamanensis]EMR01763.1 hypothetical protein ADICEAN_03122 [Cesiribacter andamanensis AMV16]